MSTTRRRPGRDVRRHTMAEVAERLRALELRQQLLERQLREERERREREANGRT